MQRSRPVPAFIGFGEAAMAFAGGFDAAAYDRLTDAPATRAAKLADYERHGVRPALSAGAACESADLVLSLVTADQALTAAGEASRGLAAGALYLDMNSVAPGTKQAAARIVSAAGARYADVAVMAPALPLRRAVPLLVSGPHAAAAAEALAALGFADVKIAGAAIGQAATVKMLRSIVVKGIEALTAECALAADRAGVTDAVLDALGGDWAERFDYNLERMMRHGTRRAAEMDEVAATLDALGTGSAMARATGDWQRAIGARGIAPAPRLSAKLAALTAGRRDEAA